MMDPQALLHKVYNQAKSEGGFTPFYPGEPEIIGDEYYVEIPDAGISLVLDDTKAIDAIHLYSDVHEGYEGYAYNLPHGIRFSMSRGEVRDLLGTPCKHSDGVKVPVLGDKPAWDLFVMKECVVHLEYVESKDSIKMVTVSKSYPGMV